MKAILIIIALFLTGCGFHLSGSLPLAPNLHNLYLETNDPYGQLTKNLKIYLRASDVIVEQKPEEAKLILEIISETTSQQMIGISAKQDTRVYNLILTVIFQVKNSQGKILVPPQTMRQIGSLTIQSDQILAGSNQADNIYQQLRVRIIYDIMSRLSSKEITSLLIT